MKKLNRVIFLYLYYDDILEEEFNYKYIYSKTKN